MIWEREYWHYQRHESISHKPFAVQLIKQINTEQRPFISLTAIVYCENLQTKTQRVIVESTWPFTIESFTFDIAEEVNAKGVVFDEEEYYDLVTFVIECLQDNRQARESEIL